MDDVRRVAFCGLGIMGRPMAINLARAGFEFVVWNRTAERARALAAENGMRAAATPVEAAEEADALITMVVDAPEVESVLFGDEGAAQGLATGSLCIDMSTIAPTRSRAIAERLDVPFLDAPVTGSRPKAEEGTLTIMVGGEQEAFERARPLFDAMGELVVHVGPQGHGSMTKVIANTIAAINAAALGEALGMVRAADLDIERFLEVARAGSSGSTMLELKAGPMVERDYDPLFKLEHMLKDVRHCLAEARALGIDLRLAEMVERMYARAAEDGLGELDFAAIAEVAASAKSG